MDVSLARNGRWSYLHCSFPNTARRPSKFSACRKNARRWGAEAAALSFGMTVTLAPVHDDAEIEGAIATTARARRRPHQFAREFSITNRDVIIAATARHSFPLIGGAIYYQGWRTDVLLVLLSPRARTGGILRRQHPQGAAPSDLPVQPPTKFSLIINLKAAKALVLTIPPNVLEIAEEVIE